jgi:hypothetical protein
MKNIWKWILGILVVVLVLAAVGFTAYMWTSHSGFMMASGWDSPMMRGNDGWNRGWNNGPTMMTGRGGFLPFFGPLALLGGLVKLVFFGALLYGAYWLGRRNARVVVDAPPAAPAEPAPQTDKPA